MENITSISDEQIAKATGVPADQIRAERERRAAVNQANAAAMPGPVADAFAIMPDIEVGKYKVRPFYDIDFELLASLEHPLERILREQDSGTAVPFRGQAGWDLCWLLTHTPDECEEAVKDKSLHAKAKAGFSRMPLSGIMAIVQAVYKQLDAFWSPMLSYEAQDEEGVKKNSSLGQSLEVKTASAG
jgi:hypothetical protein